MSMTHIICELQAFNIQRREWLPAPESQHPWTTAQGADLPAFGGLESFPHPEGHLWIDDWSFLSHASSTDIDGWSYSPTLTGPWSPQNWSNSNYRRRTWQRKSMQHALEVSTYENERWFVGVGFSPSARLPTDRYHWSDDSGRTHQRKDDLDKEALPPDFRWSGEWRVFVDHPASTDPDGWTYASDFPSTYHAAKGMTSFVRRRKWIRQAVKVGGKRSSGGRAADPPTPVVISRSQLFEGPPLSTVTRQNSSNDAGSFDGTGPTASAVAATTANGSARDVQSSPPRASDRLSAANLFVRDIDGGGGDMFPATVVAPTISAGSAPPSAAVIAPLVAATAVAAVARPPAAEDDFEAAFKQFSFSGVPTS